MPSNLQCRNSFLGWILLLLFIVVIAPFALLVITGVTFASVFPGCLCTPWLTLGIIVSLFIVLALLCMLWFTIIQRVKKLFEPLFRPVILVLRAYADTIDQSANATGIIKAQFSNMASQLHTTADSLNNTGVTLPVVPAVKSLSQAMHDANSAIPVIANDPIKVLDGNFSSQTIYPMRPVGAGVETLKSFFTSASDQTQQLENDQRNISSNLRSVANLLESFIS